MLPDLPRPNPLIAMSCLAPVEIADGLLIDADPEVLEREFSDSNAGGTSCGPPCVAVTAHTAAG
jgi:hypothetical protein